MGNCCGTRGSHHPGVRVYKEKEKDEGYRLPKVIVVAQESALIYLDMSLSPESKQLKYILKHKFPNLVDCDGEKRVSHQIEMMKERKFYFIIVGSIRQQTLRYLVKHPKVRGIYFCLDEMDLGHYGKSPKIKGFFNNDGELKQAIYYDIRDGESY